MYEDFTELVCTAYVILYISPSSFGLTLLCTDPYAIMCYEGQSRLTQVCKNTLNPIWDKTLVINDVILFGEPRDINNYSPIVTVEFNDKDTVVRKNHFFPILTTYSTMFVFMY